MFVSYKLISIMSTTGGSLHRTSTNRSNQARGGNTPGFAGPTPSGIPVPAPPTPSESGSGLSDVRRRQSKKDEVCLRIFPRFWLRFVVRYVASMLSGLQH